MMGFFQLSCLLMLFCTSLAIPTKFNRKENKLYSDLVAELQMSTGNCNHYMLMFWHVHFYGHMKNSMQQVKLSRVCTYVFPLS